jgi:hypothetical protein
MSVLTRSTVVLFAFCIGSICYGADPWEEQMEAAVARKQLIGEWEFVSARVGDQEQKATANRAIKLTISDGKIVRKLGERRLRHRPH